MRTFTALVAKWADLDPVEDDDWGLISAVLYEDLTQIWVEPVD